MGKGFEIEQVTTRKKKFTYFIGIDISKNKLDYAVLCGRNLIFHREAKNTKDEILAFVSELKVLPGFTINKAVFCMEHTGIYGNHLLVALKKIKANFTVENPLQIQKSLGLLRGKTDKIDAIRIAQYAQKNRDELKLAVLKRPIILKLANLATIRRRLLGVSVILKTAAGEQVGFVSKDLLQHTTILCERTVAAIGADLIDINTGIETLINSDLRLKELQEQICSVPGVGRVTAVQIILCTNEFKDIKNPKKFACYAGVAPFRKESGLSIKKARISPIANRKMKSLLHMCAIRAITCDAGLKVYYERKTKIEGKPKMLVVNAVRSKLILRIFACVNQNRPFERNYVRQNR